MKYTFYKLLVWLLVLCMVGMTAVACKNEPDEPEETTAQAAGVTEVPDDEYAFPKTISLSDDELNIFNFSEYYNAIIYTDVETYSDKISQAVYDRNVYFEEMYDVFVVEEQLPFTGRVASFAEATTKLATAFMGGDDIYDVAYVSLFDQYSLITTGVLMDLNTVSTVDLEAEWWDPQFNNSFILQDGKCYVAASALNLMPYEMTWSVFFNRKLAEERELPNLFEYVRNGEWTVENMLKIIQDSGFITENASGGYTFDANETAMYGAALHSQSTSHLLTGFGVSFIQPDEDGTYRFECNNDDNFYTASEWLLQLFDRNTGMAIGSDYEDDIVNHPEGYVPVFNSGRALFLHAELKSGMTLKKILNSEINYGMLPQPKLSEGQDGYYTSVANSTMMLAIPAINGDALAVGSAVDVLSYLSHADVLPVYYNDYVSYRNVSDPDSLEMLNDYIMPGRRMEIGKVYGWMNDFVTAYDSLIYTGKSNSNITLANIIRLNTETVNAKIEAFFS